MLLQKVVLMVAIGGGVAFTAADARAHGFGGRLITQERAVKQMPLEQRPNRLGHVYGNNVRRLQSGRLIVNTAQPGVRGLRGATRRFLYLP